MELRVRAKQRAATLCAGERPLGRPLVKAERTTGCCCTAQEKRERRSSPFLVFRSFIASRRVNPFASAENNNKQLGNDALGEYGEEEAEATTSGGASTTTAAAAAVGQTDRNARRTGRNNQLRRRRRRANKDERVAELQEPLVVLFCPRCRSDQLSSALSAPSAT